MTLHDDHYCYIFFADSKPKVRTHYRAHKLSFWLHLVPDLQRNGYGAPSGHHNVNQNPISSSSSSSASNVIPVHPNSGLVILPPEDPTHNSSTPPPPTIQLVGPPMWEHDLNKQRGNFFQGKMATKRAFKKMCRSRKCAQNKLSWMSLLYFPLGLVFSFEQKNFVSFDRHSCSSNQGSWW